jgi:hypothetical protein
LPLDFRCERSGSPITAKLTHSSPAEVTNRSEFSELAAVEVPRSPRHRAGDPNMARTTAKTNKPATDKPKKSAAKTAVKRRTPKRPASRNEVQPPVEPVLADRTRTEPTQPISGKLGAIAHAIAQPTGATMAELAALTVWQPHTIRAAISRLRQRGIDARITDVDDRKAYRIAKRGA